MATNHKRKLLLTLLAAAVVSVACALWWPKIRNELFVIMGNRNETGGWYGFWSAFGGATRTVEYLILGMAVYWHHTCHYSPKCLRWGKYPAAEGMFKLCHRHHPDLNGERPAWAIINRLHKERAG